MSFSGRERRRDTQGDAPRRPFCDLAEDALRLRIRDVRHDEAVHWEKSPNLAWARWPLESGGFGFCAVRRNFDFLTGEMGYSPVEVALQDLPLIEALTRAMPAGCRVRLGHLLQGHDRWWSSGGTEATLIWRIDWLAHQLRLRLYSFLAAAGRQD